MKLIYGIAICGVTAICVGFWLLGETDHRRKPDPTPPIDRGTFDLLMENRDVRSKNRDLHSENWLLKTELAKAVERDVRRREEMARPIQPVSPEDQPEGDAKNHIPRLNIPVPERKPGD